MRPCRRFPRSLRASAHSPLTACGSRTSSRCFPEAAAHPPPARHPAPWRKRRSSPTPSPSSSAAPGGSLLELGESPLSNARPPSAFHCFPPWQTRPLPRQAELSLPLASLSQSSCLRSHCRCLAESEAASLFRFGPLPQMCNIPLGGLAETKRESLSPIPG